MAVTIRGKTLPLPILQGGMGVGISLDGLAGAVAACGGMGTLSTVPEQMAQIMDEWRAAQ